MIEILGAALLLGLLSNLHCLGMCGPIAFVLPLDRTSEFRKIFGIGIYNIGRIISYATLGGLFGLFGRGLQLGRFQQYTAISFGLIILIWIYLPRIIKGKHFNSSRLLRFNNFIRTQLGSKLKRTSPGSLLLIGVLNGLLPCGMVHLAIAGSLATGSFENGTVFMIFFGVGTLPAMTLTPYFANRISTSLKSKAQKILPYALTILAVGIMVRGMNLGIPYLSPKFNEDKSEITSCCHHEIICYENN
ncbi:MAG: sulfite exporter TauE/SafE family protein [Flavobacteriales bacterium]|nr:sulfite exporter TauE/SafE family protein [Flavobacteriales bacterium]